MRLYKYKWQEVMSSRMVRSNYGTRKQLVAGLVFSLVIVSAIGIHFVSAVGTAYSWHASSQDQSWLYMAASSNGEALAAVPHTSGLPAWIYTSTDGGVSWQERQGAGQRNWNGVASDASGQNLVAFSSFDLMLFTSNDGGVTWTQQAGADGMAWSNVASSADGQKMVATATGGTEADAAGIYVSGDGGVSWQKQTIFTDYGYSSVAISADGMSLVAAVTGAWNVETNSATAQVWVSHNGGSVWVDRSAQLGAQFSEATVAVSGDGATYALAAHSESDGAGDWSQGRMWLSKDAGLTWELQSAVGAANWTRVALNENGENVIVAGDQTMLYSTVNGGADWKAETEPGVQEWWYVLLAQDDATPVYAGVGYTTTVWKGALDAVGSVASSPTNPYIVATDTDMILHWGVPESDGGMPITSYSVQYRTSNDAPWTVVEDINGTSYSLIGAQRNTTYQFRVAAENSNGLGVYTSVVYKTSAVAVNVRLFKDVASSADGQDLVIGAAGGYVYVSHDAGITWQPQQSIGVDNWTSVDISADGTRLVAVASSGSPDTYSYIFLSSDGGATWQPAVHAGLYNWSSVAMSDTGQVLVATSRELYGTSYVSVSRDYGVSWNIEYEQYGTIVTGAVSGDGAVLGAAQLQYPLIVSYSEYNWQERVFVGSRNWTSLAISTDGTNMIAGSREQGASETGYLYYSTDGGTSWSVRTATPGSANWSDVALSNDSSLMLALDGTGRLFGSSNQSVSWELLATLPGGVGWQSLAIDATGQRIVAVSQAGSIYISNNQGATWTQRTVLDSTTPPSAPYSLNVKSQGAAAVYLSWSVWDDGGLPITGVTVQYSTNQTNWTTIAFDDPIATGNLNGAQIGGLVLGTTYYFRVSIANTAGTSPISNSVSGAADYLSLSTGSAVSIPVTQTVESSRVSSRASTITVSTNTKNGYNLYMSLEDDDMAIHATSGDGVFEPVPVYGEPGYGVLAPGTWGFRLANPYFGDSEETTAETNTPSSAYVWDPILGKSTASYRIDASNTPVNGRSFNVWFGINAAPNQPAGTYSKTIIYTIIANGDGTVG